MKFDYIIWANNVAKTKNGSFSGNGDWINLKCFVDNLRGYGEFYINLNKATGEGEIRYKDVKNYGEFLSKEFEMEMKGILDDIEKLDREAEKYEEPAYLRKGKK